MCGGGLDSFVVLLPKRLGATFRAVLYLTKVVILSLPKTWTRIEWQSMEEVELIVPTPV